MSYSLILFIQHGQIFKTAYHICKLNLPLNSSSKTKKNSVSEISVKFISGGEVSINKNIVQKWTYFYRSSSNFAMCKYSEPSCS